MINTESAAMRMLRFAGRGIERIPLKIMCIGLLAAILGQTNEF
jgi:hypothetical protein